MKKEETKLYGKLLKDIVVPSNLPFDEQMKLYMPLNDFLIKNTPKKLFRYRECSELNIDAFDRCQIWVSRAIDMNDDFDTRISYKRNAIQKWIDNFFESDDSLKILSDIRSGKEIPDNIKSLPYATEFLGFIKQTTHEQLLEGAKYFNAFLNHNFKACIDSLIEIAKRNLKFACFSESIESPAMWGLYANDGKGFALSYDFTNNKFCNCYGCEKANTGCIQQKMCSLMPVNYSELRYDGTDFIIYLAQYKILQDMAWERHFVIPPHIMNTIIACDNFASSKVSLHKSSEWRHEKEWRLFCSCQDPNYNQEAHSAILKAPSAIYLGRNISQINEKTLMHIAKEKSIPVYKMEIPEDSRRYKLIPKLITK